MSRPRRPHLPGAPFHLTARVQWKLPLLLGLEAGVIGAIDGEAAAHRVRVVAHTVMSNHVHILAVQGQAPLGWFMRSLGRRIALIVMKAHKLEGHVFERRYFASPCLDAHHLRAVFAYVHLNPVRAGVCTTPEKYAWSTHSRYLFQAPENGECPRLQGAAASMLRLFARAPSDGPAACALGYRHYLDWRLAADRLRGTALPEAASGEGLENDGHDVDLRPPSYPAGDAHWLREFAACVAGVPRPRRTLPSRQPEIRHLVLQVLAEHAPDLNLDTLRSGSTARPLVAIRRDAIRRCAAAGYRNFQIARYLCVSQSSVSAALRPARSPSAHN